MKYPKTYHLPWSLGVTNDDKIQWDLSYLEGKSIVVTEKMDGENCTITSEKQYARSLDSAYHESQSYVRQKWGEIKHLIPSGVRICGENVAAKHSIEYDKLEDYFLVFSIWDNTTCLDWDTTLEFCDLFNLKTVPVLWEGKFNENFLKNFHQTLDLSLQEGYVIRIKDSFDIDDFNKTVLKFVRANHVQTNKHWKNQKITYNKLKNEH